MARFQFGLQRVLDYRRSLVEAQEVEVSRCLARVARSRQEMESLRDRRDQTLGALATPPGRLDHASREAAWRYLDQIRDQERRCQDELRSQVRALTVARAHLADLKRDEQVMQRLKDRRQERARVQALRDEAKLLDDLTASRHRLAR